MQDDGPSFGWGNFNIKIGGTSKLTLDTYEQVETVAHRLRKKAIAEAHKKEQTHARHAAHDHRPLAQRRGSFLRHQEEEDEDNMG